MGVVRVHRLNARMSAAGSAPISLPSLVFNSRATSSSWTVPLASPSITSSRTW